MSSRKQPICLKQNDTFGIWEQFKFIYVTSYFWICKLERFLSVTLRKANQIRAWEATRSPQAAEAQLSCWLVWLSSDTVGFSCLGHKCWSHSHTHRGHPHLALDCPTSQQSHCVPVKHMTKGAASDGDVYCKFLAGCWYSKHPSTSF